MITICLHYAPAHPSQCLQSRDMRDCGRVCSAYQPDNPKDRTGADINDWRALFGYPPAGDEDVQHAH